MALPPTARQLRNTSSCSQSVTPPGAARRGCGPANWSHARFASQGGAPGRGDRFAIHSVTHKAAQREICVISMGFMQQSHIAVQSGPPSGADLSSCGPRLLCPARRAAAPRFRAGWVCKESEIAASRQGSTAFSDAFWFHQNPSRSRCGTSTGCPWVDQGD